MKFIHTADWHLGKLVHNVYMTNDQEYVLNQLITILKEEKPDCLVIAGDLYDRPIPPVAAIELLNEVFYKINIELNIPILAISGNHDSAQRLSFGSKWYEKNQLHMVTSIEQCFEPITINNVNYFLVPYCEPAYAREVFNEPTIQTHQDLFDYVIAKIKETMDHSAINVLVAHAFVLGGKETDSERLLSVGGSSCVTNQTFEVFDYVALGHLHSPDAIKHEKVFYSGSLLKYSFSEVKQNKSVQLIEFQEDQTFNRTVFPLNPVRDMREIKGQFTELLSLEFQETQNKDDYLKVILTDDEAILDPMNTLKNVYPNILHLEKERTLKDLKEKEKLTKKAMDQQSELEIFKQFYTDITTNDFTKEKEEEMMKVIQLANKGE